MRTKLFITLLMTLSVSFFSCNGANNTAGQYYNGDSNYHQIYHNDKEGIGPILLNASIKYLPASDRNGLYDTIEKHHKASYYDDLTMEYVAPRIQLIFKKHGRIMVIATAWASDQRICRIEIVSPELSYRGIHPGLPVKEAFVNGLIVNGYGTLDSCEWCIIARIENIYVDVEEKYTQAALKRFERDSRPYEENDPGITIRANDFQRYAKVKAIVFDNSYRKL